VEGVAGRRHSLVLLLAGAPLMSILPKATVLWVAAMIVALVMRGAGLSEWTILTVVIPAAVLW
jgi:hypothetical protein